MDFIVTYDTDFSRTIPAVITDARDTIPAITRSLGYLVKVYYDARVAAVADNFIPYKIETKNGNLAGYFVLDANGEVVSIAQKQLRPAFRQFDSELSQLISNFIASGKWRGDWPLG